MWRRVHWASADPGAEGWGRDEWPALEKPEGGGVWGTNTPNVLALPSGGFRMYYTLIGPTAENPDGANDYTSATSSICSAVSADGEAGQSVARGLNNGTMGPSDVDYNDHGSLGAGGFGPVAAAAAACALDVLQLGAGGFGSAAAAAEVQPLL